MFVHLACENAADYFDRRDRPCPSDLVNAKYGATYRLAHINRCLAMRDVFRAAGPSIDGKLADVFYQVPSMAALEELLRDDPYVVGGIWAEYRARPFVQLTEPSGLIDVCFDGSRRITAVEGTVAPSENVWRALERLREESKLAVGGVLEGDRLLAWLRTEDPRTALDWLAAEGVIPGEVTTRTMVWVL